MPQVRVLSPRPTKKEVLQSRASFFVILGISILICIMLPKQVPALGRTSERCQWQIKRGWTAAAVKILNVSTFIEFWAPQGGGLPRMPQGRRQRRMCPVTSTSSNQSPLCFDFFIQKSHSPASLILLFHKKSRSAHLFSCKRLLDDSLSLPTFCEILTHYEHLH